jgi:alpha-1,2-mannosyltransferase
MQSFTVALGRAPTTPARGAVRVLVACGRQLRRIPRPIVLFLASAAMVAVALLTRVDMPTFGNLRGAGFFDLKIYRQAAGIVLHGGRLYHTRFRLGLGFTYPPATAVIFTLLRLVSLRVDEVLVTTLNLFLLPVIAHCTLRLTPAPATAAQCSRRARLAWFAAAAAPWTYPVVGAIGFGQIDLLIAALVLVDLTYGRNARWGGLLVGVAAALKLTPLIFIPYLLFSGRRRMAARALGAFALSISFAFAVVPGDARAFWTGGFLDTSRVTGGGTGGGPADQSLHGAVLRIWAGLPHATPVWLAACVVVVGAGLLLAVRAARRGEEGWGFVLTALTGLLVCPISWPHHWIIALPGVLLLVEWASRRDRHFRGTTVVVFVGVVFAVGSWALEPLIAAHLAGHDLDLVGLLVGDLYVLVAMATILVAAVVDLQVRPRSVNDPSAAPPATSPITVHGLQAESVSGSSRAVAQAYHAGQGDARHRQSPP